jgi:hypothetical protein
MDISDQKIHPLFDKIMDDQNIYNAIYSMESYVFEKGILSDDDLALYGELSDKFNFTVIDKIIESCKNRLKLILENRNELFEIQVFFKIKKWDEKSHSIKYRPIHTASLIDQICMVCILQPLMFDDSGEQRKKSELTKLIPHNFYGNIPSSKVETLFEPWQRKYKEYTKTLMTHCQNYQQSHQYRTEVSLDIENFFPSISPDFIFDFIIRKLSLVFKDELDDLKIVLSKLLYFKLSKENIEGWKDTYYGEGFEVSCLKVLMNRGIPQGLPQSYFFGNLCMIAIEKIIKKNDSFNGDAYFYVDDSVIYVDKEFQEDEFKSAISELNEQVSKLNSVLSYTIGKYPEITNPDYVESQKKLQNLYVIKFHESDKSSFCPIEEANTGTGNYTEILRRASMATAIYDNIDAIEDTFTREKINKILEIIEGELDSLKDNEQKYGSNHFAYRIKLIKRYKRFFSFRLKVLEVRDDDKDVGTLRGEFEKKYIKGNDGKRITPEEWMSTYEEDIFQSEAQLLISLLSVEDAKKLKNELEEFEKGITSVHHPNEEWLFLSKQFKGAIKLKEISCGVYDSLIKWVHHDFNSLRNVSINNQHKQLLDFVGKIKESSLLSNHRYADFVFNNSDEYKRRILNAYYSEINNISTSEAKSFTKNSKRRLTYTELRIIARLRNRNFNFEEFNRFIHRIDCSDLDNRTSVDMGQLQVLGFFVSYVRKPEWVDNLIVTHRVVKGLWYNGSKFMNSYTLHNEEHAVTLIEKIVRLTKAIDYFSIKRVDYYILFLSCYLHDISMVIHPDVYKFSCGDDNSLKIITSFLDKITSPEFIGKIDFNAKVDTRMKEVSKYLITLFDQIFCYFETNIRENHAKESARLIRNWADGILKYIESLYIEEVAVVSESHGWDIPDVYGLKSLAKGSLKSEKYMMMLIRLADSLDVSNDRINYYLLRQNVEHLSPTSRFHWISHLITDEIQIRPTYDVSKDAKLFEHPLVERININIFLNVKYDSALSGSGGCKKCIADLKPELEHIGMTEEQQSKYQVISIECGNEKEIEGTCPIMCRWIMRKHKWLIDELKELQKYLLSVNSNFVQTVIRFNLIYRDDRELDADLFDDVKEYLEK